MDPRSPARVVGWLWVAEAVAVAAKGSAANPAGGAGPSARVRAPAARASGAKALAALKAMATGAQVVRGAGSGGMGPRARVVGVGATGSSDSATAGDGQGTGTTGRNWEPRGRTIVAMEAPAMVGQRHRAPLIVQVPVLHRQQAPGAAVGESGSHRRGGAFRSRAARRRRCVFGSGSRSGVGNGTAGKGTTGNGGTGNGGAGSVFGRSGDGGGAVGSTAPLVEAGVWRPQERMPRLRA